MSTSTADFALIHATVDKVTKEWQEERARLMNDVDRARNEVQALRKYLDGQMRQHFQSYNGGLQEQLRRFGELRLPLPWVPCSINGFGDGWAPSTYEPAFDTVTYIKECRMVPIHQAGRV